MKEMPTVNAPAINLLSMQGTALLKVLISVTITGLLIVADMEQRKIKRSIQGRKLASLAITELESSLHTWLAQPGTVAYSFGEHSKKNVTPRDPTKPVKKQADYPDGEKWKGGTGGELYIRTTAYRGMNKEAYKYDAIHPMTLKFQPLIPEQISVFATGMLSTAWIISVPTTDNVPTNNNIEFRRGRMHDILDIRYFATHIVIPDKNANGTFNSSPGSGTVKLMPGNGALKNFIGYPNQDGTNIQSIAPGGLAYIRAMWVEAAKDYAPSTAKPSKPVDENKWASYTGTQMSGMVHLKVLIWTFSGPQDISNLTCDRINCIRKILTIPIYANISYDSSPSGIVGTSATLPPLTTIINGSFGLECMNTLFNVDPAANTCTEEGFFFNITRHNQKLGPAGEITEENYDGRCCKPVNKSQR